MRRTLGQKPGVFGLKADIQLILEAAPTSLISPLTYYFIHSFIRPAVKHYNA